MLWTIRRRWTDHAWRLGTPLNCITRLYVAIDRNTLLLWKKEEGRIKTVKLAVKIEIRQQKVTSLFWNSDDLLKFWWNFGWIFKITSYDENFLSAESLNLVQNKSFPWKISSSLLRRFKSKQTFGTMTKKSALFWCSHELQKYTTYIVTQWTN